MKSINYYYYFIGNHKECSDDNLMMKREDMAMENWEEHNVEDERMVSKKKMLCYVSVG